jgi:hypothetical protein
MEPPEGEERRRKKERKKERGRKMKRGWCPILRRSHAERYEVTKSRWTEWRDCSMNCAVCSGATGLTWHGPCQHGATCTSPWPALVHMTRLVFQNSVEGNNSNTSEFVVFSKIQKKSAKIEKIDRNEVEPREEQEKFWNTKFGRFDQIINRFFKKNQSFLINCFCPLRRFE